MTKESFSVRPRMKASGATSIVPRSTQLPRAVVVDHVVQRVVERPEVRVHLLREVAGQEAELLAGLDGRARQSTMRVKLFFMSSATAIAIAKYVFPVPAGPMPNTMS